VATAPCLCTPAIRNSLGTLHLFIRDDQPDIDEYTGGFSFGRPAFFICFQGCSLVPFSGYPKQPPALGTSAQEIWGKYAGLTGAIESLVGADFSGSRVSIFPPESLYRRGAIFVCDLYQPLAIRKASLTWLSFHVRSRVCHPGLMISPSNAFSVDSVVGPQAVLSSARSLVLDQTG
jgi:hypothetical protein